MEKIKAIGTTIYRFAIAHSEEITRKLKGLIDTFHKTDDKPRLVFHPASLKKMPSIVYKLIYKIIDKMSNEKLLIDNAIRDAEKNMYMYVGDSLRFVVDVNDESARCNIVNDFLAQHKDAFKVSSASDLANGGILVKFVENDGFRWEIQFLPKTARGLFDDASHNLYKDAQRLLANVQYNLLMKMKISDEIESRIKALVVGVDAYRVRNQSLIDKKIDRCGTIKGLFYEPAPDTLPAIVTKIRTLVDNKLDQSKGGRTRRKRQRTSKRKRFTLRKRSHKRFTRRRRTHN